MEYLDEDDKTISNEEEEKKPKQDSAKVILVKFIKGMAKQIVISENEPNKVYIRIAIENYVQVFDIQGSKFLRWLKATVYQKTNEIYATDAYKDAADVVYSEATLASATKRVPAYVRVAMTDDAVYYDLSTPDKKAIKITADEIKMIHLGIEDPLFINNPRSGSQVMPALKVHGDALEQLIKFLRISKEHQLVFKVHLITMFIEKFPMPMMIFVATEGQAKTSLTGTVKKIVDPQSAKIMDNVNKLPTHETDRIIMFAAKYLLAFDNVSHLTADQSDDCCRAVTGTTNEKRKLFTDEEQIMATYMRKIVLNGIAPNLERGDFLQRSIFYDLDFISPETRLTEEEYNQKIDNLLPHVLADCLRMLQQAMQLQPQVKEELQELPRMADFAVWGEAISRVLGEKPYEFLQKYQQMQQHTFISVSESHALIPFLQQLMEEKQNYHTTITNFYQAFKAWAVTNDYDLTSKYSNFPKAANKIRAHVMRVNSFLLNAGFVVEVSDRDFTRIDQTQRGAVYITVSKVRVPQVPQVPNKEQEQSEVKAGTDDTSGTDKMLGYRVYCADCGKEFDSDMQTPDGKQELDLHQGHQLEQSR